MRTTWTIILLLLVACDPNKPTQHEPGSGSFPGIPTPIPRGPSDVVGSADGAVAGPDGLVGELATSEDASGTVELTLRLVDPRDDLPIFGVSLLSPGSSGTSDENGEVAVELDANEAFAVGCTGSGLTPNWLAGTMGSQDTTLVLPLLTQSGHDLLLGGVGIQQDPAKASLLVRIINKEGQGASGATLSLAPQSGQTFVITGQSAVLGEAVSTADTKVLGVANLSPGSVSVSVMNADGSPCSVQPGGGSELPLLISIGASASLSFLCP